MKPTPKGWPRISPTLYYEDPKRAITWLCDAFGFEVQLLVEGDNGRVEHSELVFGGGTVMVSGTHKADQYPYHRAPTQIEGVNTQSLMVYVDDVEKHCAHARAKGAKVVMGPETHDYGDDYWSDRGYECIDPGGHHWWFFERMRDPKPKTA